MDEALAFGRMDIYRLSVCVCILFVSSSISEGVNRLYLFTTAPSSTRARDTLVA